MNIVKLGVLLLSVLILLDPARARCDQPTIPSVTNIVPSRAWTPQALHKLCAIYITVNARLPYDVGIVGPNRNPSFFSELEEVAGTHAVATSKRYDYLFVLQNRFTGDTLVFYSSNTGEIGSGRTWFYVSRTFRDRMKRYNSRLMQLPTPTERWIPGVGTNTTQPDYDAESP